MEHARTTKKQKQNERKNIKWRKWKMENGDCSFRRGKQQQETDKNKRI